MYHAQQFSTAEMIKALDRHLPSDHIGAYSTEQERGGVLRC